MLSTDGILQDRFQQRTAGSEQHSDASDLCLLAPRSLFPEVKVPKFRGLGTMQVRMLMSVKWEYRTFVTTWLAESPRYRLISHYVGYLRSHRPGHEHCPNLGLLLMLLTSSCPRLDGNRLSDSFAPCACRE